MPSSVIITIELEVKPKSWPRYLKRLSAVLKNIRTFPGLQDIQVMEHKQHPNRLLFIEKWNSEADYEAYASHGGVYQDDLEMNDCFVATPVKDVWSFDVSGI